MTNARILVPPFVIRHFRASVTGGTPAHDGLHDSILFFRNVIRIGMGEMTVLIAHARGTKAK